MEKYGIKIFYPYNITEHIHHEGDGHHFEGDGHEDDVMQAIEARKRFLLIGGILLSVICGVGIIFMITTHFLSRRKFANDRSKNTSSHRHIVLRRRTDELPPKTHHQIDKTIDEEVDQMSDIQENEHGFLMI